MTSRRILPVLALAAASAVVLAGCASTDAGADDGRISIVASTNVYGQIAQEVGGDLVDVSAIVSSAAQDPHSFEASARDQLSVNRADLIIENGAGYDAFMDALIESSAADAPVITAAELSPEWPADDHGDDTEHDDHADDDHGHDDHDHIEGFNEHVWYDPATMGALATEIAHELGELDPDNAAAFEANAATFQSGIDGLAAALAEVEASAGGAGVFVTEPAPVYLLLAAGLTDLTPPAFSESVEQGQDVPPATLLAALDLLRSGDVDVLIANAQTGGAETTQVIDEAETQKIPVLEFTETLPDGETYLQWMQQNIDALTTALAQPAP